MNEWYFKDTKDINLLVHDKELLKKYNETWDKISNLSKIEFNSEPVHNDKCIKTKMKICNNRINTNLHGNKTPENNEYCTCLSVILLDSIFVNADKKCYS